MAGRLPQSSNGFLKAVASESNNRQPPAASEPGHDTLLNHRQPDRLNNYRATSLMDARPSARGVSRHRGRQEERLTNICSFQRAKGHICNVNITSQLCSKNRAKCLVQSKIKKIKRLTVTQLCGRLRHEPIEQKRGTA